MAVLSRDLAVIFAGVQWGCIIEVAWNVGSHHLIQIHAKFAISLMKRQGNNEFFTA